MRTTPPPLSPPFTPRAGGKCRRVAFMAHYAACGVILSLWQKHPQAASCAVRATPKKSSALSLPLSIFLFLSLSMSNTPKFSRMSAPMPRGIPHLSPPPPLRPLCVAGSMSSSTHQATLARSRTHYYFTTSTTSTTFYSYTNNTAARLLARKALPLRCCCPFTNCSPHTHTHTRIQSQR